MTKAEREEVLLAGFKWLRCWSRGGHFYGLDAKCVSCGAEADAPTLMEVLRDATNKGETNMERQIELSFEVTGKAGDTVVACARPNVKFQPNKLIANDTAAQPGRGTRITGIRIRDVEQMPPQPGTPTVFFSGHTFGNELMFDACSPGDEVQIAVKFDQDCVFSAKLIGPGA